MAKVRLSEERMVSLFPMFNILTCLLGSLIFILGGIIIISLGVGRSVVIAPIQSTGKKPIYLEWNGKEIVIHPQKDIVPLSINIKKFRSFKDFYADLDRQVNNTAFGKLLKRINRKKQYFVVIVRPSGFGNFIFFRNYILDHKKIDVGYEPLEQNYTLRIRQ